VSSHRQQTAKVSSASVLKTALITGSAVVISLSIGKPIWQGGVGGRKEGWIHDSKDIILMGGPKWDLPKRVTGGEPAEMATEEPSRLYQWKIAFWGKNSYFFRASAYWGEKKGSDSW